jgi:hypothetical protein
MVELYTSGPPPVFMAWCFIKHRDNITFTYYQFRDKAPTEIQAVARFQLFGPIAYLKDRGRCKWSIQGVIIHSGKLFPINNLPQTSYELHRDWAWGLHSEKPVPNRFIYGMVMDGNTMFNQN